MINQSLLDAILFAGFAFALIAWVHVWVSIGRESKVNLPYITEMVGKITAIAPEIHDLVDYTQTEYEAGDINRIERKNYIVTVIHSRYPKFDLEMIRATIDAILEIDEIIVGVGEGPDDKQ